MSAAQSRISQRPSALPCRRARGIVGILALLLALPFPLATVHADYGEGLEAYLQGDYERARELWLAEASNGDAKAQLGLGILFEAGRGIPANGSEAADWYRKASNQGEATAQYNLGRLYATGTGVTRDLTQAARLWLRAADQNNAGAMHNLGVMYYQGEGVAQDYAVAADWFRKGAREGFADSEYMLGEMLRLGQGETPDIEQATEWLVRAGTQGHEPARQRLQALIEDGMVDSGAVPPEALGRRVVAAPSPSTQAAPPAATASDPGGSRRDITSTVGVADQAASSFQSAPDTGSARQEVATVPSDGASATLPEGYQVWIASFRDPGQAEFQWQNLQDTYPDLFGGLQSQVSPSAMGEGRGVFYRLLAGPMESPAKGQAICDSLLRRAPGSFCRLLDPNEDR